MKFKYFDISEFDCQETGNNNMSEGFIHKLDALREACGFPFKITSGYRDPSHSIERTKRTSGTHSLGIAADIRIHHGADRYTIVQTALSLGFTGIGIAKTFVHVDVRESTPVIWTYS